MIDFFGDALLVAYWTLILGVVVGCKLSTWWHNRRTLHRMIAKKEGEGFCVRCSCGWKSAQIATNLNAAVDIYHAHLRSTL